MNKMILIGGGGHCKSVLDVIEQENKYEVGGIIDKKELVGNNVMGYPYIGADEELEQLHNKYKYALVTVGQIRSPEPRIRLFYNLIHIGYTLPSIISPLSYVSKHAEIGAGTVIMHNVIVNAGAKVGKNVIVNTNALIEHDAVVGDNCHISTGAIVNGGSIIADGTFLGSNSAIKEYARSKEGMFIKANSLFRGN